MGRQPDFTVRIVDANGNPDSTVAVIDGIDDLSPAEGDFIVYENGAYSVRHMVDADVPATLARDAEVSAAYVAKALYDANTVLAATSDNTPAPVTMAASTILARLAAGDIKAATPAELKTLLAITEGDVASLTSDLAAKVSKSLYDANTILAATTDDTPAALTVPASTFVGRKASGGISAMSVTEALAVLGGLQAPTVQASASSHTGDGVESTLASHTVPQGGLGTKGYLRVSAQGITAGSGTCHVRLYWGSTVLNDAFLTDPWTWWFDALIAYYNNDQASWACNLRRWQGNTPRPTATPNINFVGDRKTGTLDLSAGTGLLKITGQLISNTADTVTCDGFVAEPVYVA